MSGDTPRWHAALAFAVLGAVPTGLTEVGRPDLDRLERDLVAAIGPDRLRNAVRQQAGAGARPHRVPAELMSGIGAAQFAAALTELRRRLAEAPVRRVTSARALTADERRLADDVPPHHGS